MRQLLDKAIRNRTSQNTIYKTGRAIVVKDSVSTAIQSATKELASKNYKNAIDILVKADIDFPDNTDILMLLGAAYAQNNQYQEAMDSFKKSASIDPSARVYYNIAALNNLQGNTQKAEELLKKALGIDPTYSRASKLLDEITKSQVSNEKAVVNSVPATQAKQDNSINQLQSSPQATISMPVQQPPAQTVYGAPPQMPNSQTLNLPKKEIEIGKNWPKVILGGLMVGIPFLLLWFSWASILSIEIGLLGGILVSAAALGIFLKWLADSAGAYEIQHWIAMFILTGLIPALIIIKGFDIMAAGWVVLKE